MYEDNRNMKCVDPGTECCEPHATMKDNAQTMRKMLMETRYRAKIVREKLLGPEPEKDDALEADPNCLLEELRQANRIAAEVMEILEIVDSAIC